MAQGAIRIEGLDKLLSMIRELSSSAITKDLMGEIGIFVVDNILARTAEGVDYENRTFEPYSPKYKLFRMKTGHPHQVVNLFFHGSMLSALTHSAGKDKVEIFFMNTYGKTPSGKASKVSNPAKAYYLNQNREFFGVSSSDEKVIEKMILDALTEIIRRG